ncbi:MAG: methylenetetrahydrofolate reductase [NAD(P)H] [Pseudomonadota bacterium]
MSHPPQVSFEFFPPKSLQGSFRLWDTLSALAPLRPDFVSVTYGAGGTTRALTHDAVKTIGGHYGLNVAAHLTCVEATRAETLKIAESYASAGVRRIVALRGDPPGGVGSFRAHDDGFASSVELVAALADLGCFDICVGAYPDPHPEAQNPGADIDWLKRKIDAGATSAITQFFFEPETFLRFRDACAAAGISAPILPGILPIEDWASVKRFSARCGVPIPAKLDTDFERATRDGRAELLATVTATMLCSRLIDEGVEHLHFYTLNKPDLTRDVCAALGLAANPALAEVA